MSWLNAQVHWDVGAEVGVLQRITTDRGSGSPLPLPGPVGELSAHVAVIPMVRVGAYVAHDISPVMGFPARQITEAGVRARISPPMFRAPWRAWAYFGVGYARAYEPGHTLSSPGAVAGFVPGAGGGIFDVPLGVALGYRLSHSWEPFVEFGGRVGLAFAGTMYDAASCSCAGEFPGRDSFALSLSLGLNLNQ